MFLISGRSGDLRRRFQRLAYPVGVVPTVCTVGYKYAIGFADSNPNAIHDLLVVFPCVITNRDGTKEESTHKMTVSG